MLIGEMRDIRKYYGDRLVLKIDNFKIYTGDRIGIVGMNGAGKTMFLNIFAGKVIPEEGQVRLRDETFARTLLARLLFRREDLNKKVEVLSGGERVKGTLAKIMVSNFNVLILDEPTNYLDIYSMEAVEEALREYKSTLIFVSHDRKFVNNIADHIISIEENKLVMFQGNLKEYLNSKEKTNKPQQNNKQQLMILENHMAEILGRLSMPSKKDNIEALDKEYKEILSQLKQLRNVSSKG